jgi:hypothetical protein
MVAGDGVRFGSSTTCRCRCCMYRGPTPELQHRPEVVERFSMLATCPRRKSTRAVSMDDLA